MERFYCLLDVVTSADIISERVKAEDIEGQSGYFGESPNEVLKAAREENSDKEETCHAVRVGAIWLFGSKNFGYYHYFIKKRERVKEAI